jgi:hypothetical protein
VQALSARAAALLAATTLALITTACAKDTTASSPAPSPTPSAGISASAVATTAAAQKPGLTPQGFLPKAIGQAAGSDCPGTTIETCGVQFQVNSVEINPTCVQYGTPAAAGRKTVLMTVSLTTGTMTPDGAIVAPVIFNPFSLKGIGADGFVHDAQIGKCTNFEGRLSSTILPNSKYEGTVEVDLPESVTSVASAHQSGADGNRGWVWPLG